MNNLLRCDLSIAQLDTLAESKGGWWLADDYYGTDDAVLLKKWNGFKFYFVEDDNYDDHPPLYCITPEGYFLSAAPEPYLDDENCKIHQSDSTEQIKYWDGLVDDAIATLLNFPETQGQLNLLEFNYVAN